MPVDPVALLLPYGCSVRDIRVTGDTFHHLETALSLPRSQRPAPFEAPLAPDGPDSISAGELPWPARPLLHHRIESVRGWQVLRLLLAPVRLEGPSTPPRVYQGLTITLRLTTDGVAPGLFRPDPVVARRLARTVLNPAVLATYPDEPHPPLEVETPAFPGVRGPVDWLVVAPARWRSVLQPLRARREADGWITHFLAIEDLHLTFPGQDEAARLRHMAETAYAAWGLRYLLLAGAEPAMPDRRVYARPWPGGRLDNFPSDLYFAAVEPRANRFDGNANGRHGEPNDGLDGLQEPDLSGDIAVGRLPVRNQDALSNAVRRILHYESLPADTPSLRRGLGLSEFLGLGAPVQTADPLLAEWEAALRPGWPLLEIQRLSQRLHAWSGQQVLQAWEQGVHLVWHLGHGKYDRIMKLRRSSLETLPPHMPFFLYTHACFGGAFDRHRSFAECLFSSPSGPFAMIAGAREGWQTRRALDGASQRFALAFWAEAAEAPHAGLGQLLHAARDAAGWDPGADGMRWTSLQMNLLGDPAQRLRRMGPAHASPGEKPNHP